MVRDLKYNVMIKISRMVMVVIVTVKLKRDGTVKEDHQLNLVLVSIQSLITLIFLLLEQFICSEKLFKASDCHTFPMNSPKMTVLCVTNLFGLELLTQKLFQESELSISPIANINSWLNFNSMVSLPFQSLQSVFKLTLISLTISVNPTWPKFKSKGLTLLPSILFH